MIEEHEPYISLNNCKHGYLYRLDSRNLSFGIFNKDNNGFIGIRTKFGDKFLFTEFHLDIGEPYGTVKPLEELCKLPEDIEINDSNDKIYTYLMMFSFWRTVLLSR